MDIPASIVPVWKFGLVLLIAASSAGVVIPREVRADNAKVVELTQTGCQFVEPEGKDRQFVTRSKADCEKINGRNGEERVAASKTIELAPGEYVFRVTNRNVPYELGFWLRSKGYDWKNPVHKLTKVSVSGGGIMQGESQEYRVTLEPGEYVYSCPLNTTPDYKLTVVEER